MLTLSQRRAWARRGAQDIERTIREAKAEIAAAEEKRSAEASARYAEATKPVPFTTDELKAAKFIRTDIGWHKVVRVNTKSVSVETSYSWVDRYTLNKILEVRT